MSRMTNGSEVQVAAAPRSANGTYGSEVAPAGPVQDMWAVDVLAGSPGTRDDQPASFTGGTGGAGLGGAAEPAPPGGDVYERVGF